MTTFDTDYTTTELLDQKLTTAELSHVYGGCGDTTNTIVDHGFNGLPSIAEFICERLKDYINQQRPIGL